MAKARLLERHTADGETVFEVEADPWTGPYTGPPDTSWCSPRMEDGGLGYEWSSDADEATEAIARFHAGDESADAVLRIGDMQERVDGLEDLREEFPEDADFYREAFASLDLFDQDRGIYPFEGDAQMAAAASAIPLPRWARAFSDDSGGPGSGYTAWYIALEASRSAAELCRWLQATERRALMRSYRAARYHLEAPAGRLELRAGVVASGVDALLAEGENEWAFLTAWNPGSSLYATADNERRQQALESTLDALGHRHFAGWGENADASHRERSCFVPGLSAIAATDLARVFGQNAILVGRRGEKARVLWTAHARTTQGGGD